MLALSVKNITLYLCGKLKKNWKVGIQNYFSYNIVVGPVYNLVNLSLQCVNFTLTDMMPSVEDFLMLLVIPLLEYVIHPHLQRSMKIKIRPIHKVWRS